MKKSYLSRLGTFTHVEIKALALAGLVLMDAINAGRIVANCADDADELEKIIGLIDAGYALQDAIHSADDVALPGLLAEFCTIAARGQS